MNERWGGGAASGYGIATGKPTEASLIACAAAVVRFLTDVLAVPLVQGAGWTASMCCFWSLPYFFLSEEKHGFLCDGGGISKCGAVRMSLRLIFASPKPGWALFRVMGECGKKISLHAVDSQYVTFFGPLNLE